MQTQRQLNLDAITQLKIAIEQLQRGITLLERENCLICDDKQWYKESIETEPFSKRKETRNVGRIYWNENFTDEDSGETITIERSRMVMINGEWLI